MHRVKHETQVVAGVNVNVPQSPVKLQFGDYLNQPCYAAAASRFPRPCDLSDLHEGDFDVLIIHKKMGLIAGEIKSVGIRAKDQGLTDPQIENDVLKMLRKMLKMSKKSTRGKQSSRKGTGKTLTAVIMGVEWMRRNKTVDILSGDRKSRAAAHHIKQQLEETARLVIGPQAASRGPGHEERYTWDCEACGREVGRILTQVLHVGQGGNPSSSSTTALQYRDVFALSVGSLHDDVRDDAGHVTRPAIGVVRGLRQAGVPQTLFVSPALSAIIAISDNTSDDDDDL
nr:hypothetical protein BaRGS_027784 [Batillaria attramentaria]